MSTVRIAGRVIGDNYEPFIIAEAGINHNGDITLAKRMILAAIEAGADAVKFQTFSAEEFIQDKTTMYTYTSQGKTVTEPMIDMFKRNEFSHEEWRELAGFCKKEGILFLSTPGNISDLDFLLTLDLAAIKVGSDDFVNGSLIREYGKKGKPLLLSCGMADEEEIRNTLKAAGVQEGKEVCLLLCTSEYPTPPADVNIRKLVSIQKKYPQVVPGLSDHTQGSTAAVMAVSLGARIFEKHFTMDHDLPGPDHWFSEEPVGLKVWVREIRTAFEMLGTENLEPTDAEQEMRYLCRRSITASRDIKEGEIFSDGNLYMRRPGSGLSGMEWDNIVGRQAARCVKAGEQLTKDDVL